MPKKRVSLTLEEELIQRLDSEADSENVNRSNLVEGILEEYFRKRSIETAAVLCGDEESRSLEEFEGKPVIRHILGSLEEEGVIDVKLLVGGNTGIRDELGDRFGKMRLDYIEDPCEGTAEALSRLEGSIDSDFLVVNGHVITDVDLEEMVKKHRDGDSLATIALTTVEDPTRYGVARMKGDLILGFEEKPEKGEEPSRLINAGTYIMSPEIFSRLNSDSLSGVFRDLASDGELQGYVYGGEWIDVSE